MLPFSSLTLSPSPLFQAEAGQTRAEVAHPGGPTPSPWVPQASRGGGFRGPLSELKSCDQILKQRWKTEKQRFLQSGGLKKLRGMGKQRLNDQKKFGFSPDVHKKGQMKKRL